MNFPKKPVKTGPSAATTIILAFLCLMVAGYALFHISRNAAAEYTTVAAYAFEADDATAVSGCVIRQELLLPNAEGVLDVTRAEGERVSVGHSVATVYTSSDALALEDQLQTKRSQLERVEFLMEERATPGAAAKLDGNIHTRILSMRKNVALGQYAAAEQDAASLQALVLQRTSASSSGASMEELNAQAQAQALRGEIASLQGALSRSARRINAPQAGLFSAAVDGYEGVLTPEALEEMTPSQFAGVKADESVSSNVGKLILGDTWYFAANMDEGTAGAYRTGRRVTVRFPREVAQDLVMKVHRVSDTENGQKLVVFSCDKYLPEVTQLRRQSASIIHASYSGIRVPSEALRVEENVTGVYCLVGLQAGFKPVDVVYQGKGYYLVSPKKKSDNTENQSSTRLRVGDLVLITAEELYDGKVVQ